MAEHLITGHAGVGHVTSADAGAFQAGVCGLEKYVLGTGTKLSYVLESNNLITIYQGDMVNQGRHITIDEPVSLTIENGTQNKKRIDTVVMRYSKDETTAIESATLLIVRGEDVDLDQTAVPGDLISGDIFGGALADDMPLYYINISALSVTSVTKAFTQLGSLTDLNETKVDMTDALLNLDTSAASGTDDAELYDAIRALGWQNDVIV